MGTRRPLIAGNWKLHNTVGRSRELVEAIAGELDPPPDVDLAVAPVFTALDAVGRALRGTPIALAAQDVHWEDEGAFTGEVSAPLLRDVGCTYGIVGHSERRHLFGERDEEVGRKVEALRAHGLTPILCVGETLEQRDAEQTTSVVRTQLDAALPPSDSEDAAHLVIAYEPVWAIGTGRTAKPADAQAVHGVVRQQLRERYGDGAAGAVRILYGGSVKPDNAAALLQQEDIDGALVGGASLDVGSFAAIARAAPRP